MNLFERIIIRSICILCLVSLFLTGCSSVRTKYVEVPTTQEVIVTEIVEVEKEVVVTEIVEVPVISEVIVEKEVVKEVPVEIIKEVVVEKEIIVEIEKPCSHIQLQIIEYQELKSFIEDKGAVGETRLFPLENALFFVSKGINDNIDIYLADNTGKSTDLKVCSYRASACKELGLVLISGTLRKTVSYSWSPAGTIKLEEKATFVPLLSTLIPSLEYSK